MPAPFFHHLLRVLWLARPHLGSVPGTLLRSFLAALVRGLGGPGLLLALCEDGSGHFLWYSALCEAASDARALFI